MLEDKNIDLLVESLQDTKLPSGVSFAGQGLRLNSAEDAQQIVDAIIACGKIEYLNLEGNTIGVEAAIAIGKALEEQGNLKHALWKDMFTGRLKDEIPKALKSLCNGVMKAGARLEILDLSDNASGPIGVDGIADFIKSPSCYSLKELRLNNMGLGIKGAQMLSEALLHSCEQSENNGNPLKLKVFIAGRNRLENEGIKFLSRVFKKMESLEELSVPQNSIYTEGIKALSDALKHNVNLKKLNLNDNTLGEEGARALSKVLVKINHLKILDLGDCLIRTAGAYAISSLLSESLNIEEVNLSYNSINISGALSIISSLESKKNLTSLKLDGNSFGEQGKLKIKKKMADVGIKPEVLDSLDDIEDDNDNDDENSEEDIGEEDVNIDEEDDDEIDYEEEDDESDDNYDEYDDDYDSEDIERDIDIGISEPAISPQRQDLQLRRKTEKEGAIPASEILSNPTIENLVAIGNDAGKKIFEEIKNKHLDDVNTQVKEVINIIMTISSLLKAAKAKSIKELQVKEEYKIIVRCTNYLYGELFNLSINSDNLSAVNNILPAFLGLIKDENKTSKKFVQEYCLSTVNEAMKQSYFPQETSKMLKFVMANRPQENADKFLLIK